MYAIEMLQVGQQIEEWTGILEGIPLFKKREMCTAPKKLDQKI